MLLSVLVISILAQALHTLKQKRQLGEDNSCKHNKALINSNVNGEKNRRKKFFGFKLLPALRKVCHG